MVLPFLYLVMEMMKFPPSFIAWIKMCHAGATTCFILNFLTRPMDLLISVRQGDPLAMCLFLLYMEPLLVMIRTKIKGKSFLGERVHNIRLQGSVHNTPEECVTTHVNICIEDEEDLLIVDNIFRKFEEMSGAILILKQRSWVLGSGRGRVSGFFLESRLFLASRYLALSSIPLISRYWRITGTGLCSSLRNV